MDNQPLVNAVTALSKLTGKAPVSVKTKTLIDPALPRGVRGWFNGDDPENYSRNGK
ncbi:hypothetical protein FOIG_01197 [Fusarium odoratissimum NRRL 54006]|uniref:Uncharacterized protein n=1 Tax=Fusarium odoratissimum (strain NRRL 54006) TaxID=1089451 RepID=X0KSD7_FUSO5|nr:uncharacterized protein FOIG_01197 [Fusarium odoratissimum NRRL 54006]EXM11596.1 hypothetical protein FOIG_01197 [Fusarium odoratissimum NRRL 54006]